MTKQDYIIERQTIEEGRNRVLKFWATKLTSEVSFTRKETKINKKYDNLLKELEENYNK
jgi:hypothetical protein